MCGLFFLPGITFSAEDINTETDNNTTIGRMYHTLEEKKNPTGIELMDNVTMGILLEIEAGYESQGNVSSSDINLATFGMGIDAVLQEGVEGHIYFLWEDGDDAISIDEGYIKLGNTQDIPPYIQVGTMYLPFGAYHTHFISDPITLELGETRENAILAGYENDIFQVAVATFNGEFDSNSDDQINDFMAAVTLTPFEGIEIGGYWTSDLGESDGLIDILHEHIDAADDHPEVEYKSVNGIGGYMHFEKGFVSIDAEYIAALDSFVAGTFHDNSAKPKAWNGELAFTIPHNVELAAKIEGSDDFVTMPETQFGVAGTYGFTENVAVTLEYLHGEFDGDIPSRDLVTTQLSMSF